MIKKIGVIFIGFLSSLLLSAQIDIPKKLLPKLEKKTGYMSSGEAETFEAKVKIVRQIQDETEVFFEGGKAFGAYLLPSTLKNYHSFMEKLDRSRKPGGPPVRIQADEQKRIQNVEISEPKKGSGDEVGWDNL